MIDDAGFTNSDHILLTRNGAKSLPSLSMGNYCKVWETWKNCCSDANYNDLGWCLSMGAKSFTLYDFFFHDFFLHRVPVSYAVTVLGAHCLYILFLYIYLCMFTSMQSRHLLLCEKKPTLYSRCSFYNYTRLACFKSMFFAVRTITMQGSWLVNFVLLQMRLLWWEMRKHA